MNNEAQSSQPCRSRQSVSAVSNRRRRLLLGSASLVGLGLAVSAPERWVKPVINRVILPAHAQGSFETGSLEGPRFQGDFTQSRDFNCSDIVSATLRIRIIGSDVTATIGATNTVTGTSTLNSSNGFVITNFGINNLVLSGILANNQITGTFKVGDCDPTPYTATRV